MSYPIPQEERALTEECRILQHDIRRLQGQLDVLHQDPAARFVSSMGSPKPGTFFGPGNYGGAPIKRVLVDGFEVKDVEYADTERGFVIFAVTPLQVRPGTNEIWRDIKGGKVTIEYEGGPEDLRDRLRSTAARRPQSES
nr:hypothetical protein [uncultured Pseudomonas sp.]